MTPAIVESKPRGRTAGLMSLVWQLTLLLLPWSIRRPLLGLLPGFEIDRTARVGKSLIRAESVRIGANAVIGHLTLVKGVAKLQLDSDARIGNLNWITAVPATAPAHFQHLPDRDPSLIVGKHAAITHRHLIDCTGGVIIGAFATFAGWRSQIISHSFDFTKSCQDAAAISIGEYAFVGSGCILLKGCAFPERSILAAGSVYGDTDQAPLGLYRGNAAVREADLPSELGYFQRTEGFIE